MQRTDERYKLTDYLVRQRTNYLPQEMVPERVAVKVLAIRSLKDSEFTVEVLIRLSELTFIRLPSTLRLKHLLLRVKTRYDVSRTSFKFVRRIKISNGGYCAYSLIHIKKRV